MVNKEYGMDSSVADHIIKAADEVRDHEHRSLNKLYRTLSIPRKIIKNSSSFDIMMI